jgi:hypothetical protein
MKHAADEARRRRQEEEAKYEEAKARAKAKADEMAKKLDEAKLAKEKEEQAAKEKEELAKQELEANRVKEQEKAEAERLANLPATVKEFGNPNLRPHILELNEEEQKEALGKWQALPGRLAKEDADRAAQIKEKRLMEAEQRAQAANGMPATSAAAASTASTAPVVGPWRRGQLLPKAKVEPESKIESAPSVIAKKDEKIPDHVKTSLPSTQGVVHEPRVEQLDKVMHRIEESFQSRGNSVQAMEANMKRPADQSEQTKHSGGIASDGAEKDKTSQPEQAPAAITHDKTPLKEKSRNAKASRAERSTNGDSSTWRKDDKVAGFKNESIIIDDHETGKAMAAAASPPRPIGNGRKSRSAAAAYSKGNYPAKVTGANDVVKIADITRIHARLSLQSAGDQELEPSNKDGAGDKSVDQSTGFKNESSKPGVSVKRNSLSTSSAATIFPVNVEKAAKNRGSMSFMVESEIDPPHVVDTVSVLDYYLQSDFCIVLLANVFIP